MFFARTYVYERNADGTANTSNTKLGIEFTTPTFFLRKHI